MGASSELCGQVNSGTPCDLPRVGDERICPDCNPRSLQQKREAADLANHRERIQWLTADDPRWACGTPVDGGTRRILLNQSHAAVAAAAKRA